MYLFLNDVAGSEILLILLFILIFFGSKSIPGIARTVGRTMRQIQDASNDIQNEIKKSTNDYKKDLNLEGIFKETEQQITQPLDQAMDDLDHSVRYTPPKRINPAVDTEVPTHIGNEEIETEKMSVVVEEETKKEEKNDEIV